MACVHVEFKNGDRVILELPDASGWARIKGQWWCWDYGWPGPTFYKVHRRYARWPEEIFVEEPPRRVWRAFGLWLKRYNRQRYGTTRRPHGLPLCC